MSRTTRTEHDSLGPIEVPESHLWGAQTERARRHFAISTERMPRELILALVEVKRAAARVNAELGLLEASVADAIVRATDEVLDGAHPDEFPLHVWQSGSGTQTNMNVNEVLANRASEILGGPRGEGRHVHPNDHVNRGQSTNDVFPTAMSISAVRALAHGVLPSMLALGDALAGRAEAFRDVIKVGRTHMQDATPLTVGQEMGAWAAQIRYAAQGLESMIPRVGQLAIGATAVGTGLNAHPEFGKRMTTLLANTTGLPLSEAPNKFAAIATHDDFVQAHGGLKTLAVALTKVANDVRWLASGPRTALGELVLPANEPGSSIMPGKVNPTQTEALTMLAARVLGNDVSINVGGAGGALQLNVYKPLIAHCFLESCRLLADGADRFREHCVTDLDVDRKAITAHLEASLMLVTALTPHIGYDEAARIAKKAHSEGTTLRQAALALGMSATDFDAWVRPEAMLRPA
jgi:fumarate hydratase, class II